MMHRRLILACLLSAYAAAAWADDAELARQVVARDQALNALIRANDASAAAAFYDDQFVLTTGNGKRKDKAAVVAEIGNPSLKLDINDTEQVNVRVLGQTAVLTGQLHQHGSYSGGPIDARLYVTDTWVLQQGQWKLLAGHASLVKPGS
jgi:ketosteroid isomerase-like protein